MLKLMKYDPQSVLEKSNLTSRVTKLVSSLRKAKVSSKARLIEVWSTSDRKYLLDVLSLWFKEGDGQTALRKKWDSVVNQACK